MDYRRYRQAGGCYFFTLVTENRTPLLIEHIERLRIAMRHCKEKHPFTIDAIVVLPEHLHTLWTLPPDDHDFSTRWMVIKRKFSAGLETITTNKSKLAKREKGVWQRRFWEHCIRNDDDWQRHIDYIHYNPVKHSHCARPLDWRYSSFATMVSRGWYTEDWGSVVPDSVRDMDLE